MEWVVKQGIHCCKQTKKSMKYNGEMKSHIENIYTSHIYKI